MVVKYKHHGDDLVEHRTREASFGVQCTNHSANSMCTTTIILFVQNGRVVRAPASAGVDSSLISLIPSRVKPMTVKLVFIASLLDV